MSYADTIVMGALAFEGTSYGDLATRARYLLACYPFDTAAAATDMGRTQSACLLFARGLVAVQKRGDGSWEVDGAITRNGRTIDALRTPYVQTIGQIETLLTEWARQHGCLTADFHGTASSPQPDIQPGDIVGMGFGGSAPADPVARVRWAAEWGGVMHGEVVERVDGDVVTAIAGGQTDKANGGRPTAIRRVTRQLVRKGNGWWIGTRRLNWRIRVA